MIVDLLPHDRETFRVELGQARNGLEPDELERLLNSAGFSDTAFRPLPPEAGVKGPTLFLATAKK